MMDKAVEDLIIYRSQGNLSGITIPLIRLYLRIFGVPVIGFRTRFYILNKMAEKIPLKGKKVLDVGCGSGIFSIWLGRRCHVLGIDTKKERTINAEKTAKKFGIDASFESGDLFKIYKKYQGYDGAICMDVIEHIKDDTGLLQRINFMLKPGGFLIISTPNRNRKTYPHIENIVHARPGYTPESMERLLNKCSFELESICFMDPFNIYYLHYLTYSCSKMKWQPIAYILFPLNYSLIRLTSFIFRKRGSMLFLKAKKRIP